MNELKSNHQIVYHHPINAKVVCMNLLRFGYSSFLQTSLAENMEKLKILSNSVSPVHPPRIDLIAPFALSQLMDSIKIAICFENYMKAVLLMKNFVVHKFIKDIFPELYKRQYSEPITLNSIQGLWTVNDKIPLQAEFKYQVIGLSYKTIGLSQLKTRGYQKEIGIPERIIDLINQYLETRNNLHYYIDTSFSIQENSYNDFVEIVTYINENIVELHNIIINDLKKGSSYLLTKKPIL